MALLAIIQQSHLALINSLNSFSWTKSELHTFIPSHDSLKLVSLGFDQLLADCYWLAFISYIGDPKERAKDHFYLAYKYLDTITGLDPYLIDAYWFAAFTIGAEQKAPSAAAEIIDRGLRANQDKWELPFIAGTNQYLYGNNEAAAAKYYRIAARYPSAPKWLAREADILESRIPSKIKEINTWTSIFSSGTGKVKEMARMRLIDLWGQVMSTHPPKAIRDKAVKSLKELGVDLEDMVRAMKNASRKGQKEKETKRDATTDGDK